jgi:hypothetical protein
LKFLFEGIGVNVGSDGVADTGAELTGDALDEAGVDGAGLVVAGLVVVGLVVVGLVVVEGLGRDIAFGKLEELGGDATGGAGLLEITTLPDISGAITGAGSSTH